MLKRFKVQGFTSFKDEIVFDLSSPNAYAFHPECISGGVVRASVIHGMNGVGKSNLGIAIFDIFVNLTDYRIEESNYRTYLNAYLPNDDSMAEFEYTFGFGDSVVIYRYGKSNLRTFVYEHLIINDTEVVNYDRRFDISFKCILPGTETLKKTLSDNSISVLKYIKSNTERDENAINAAFDSLFDFVGKMLFFKCLNFNAFIAEPPKVNNFLSEIITADKVNDLETFLRECNIECNLGIEGEGSDRRIMNYFGPKALPLTSVWSTGTESLTLFFAWTLRMHADKVSLLFIDEFDAFYHYSISRIIIKYLRNIPSLQFVLTTHNPATISTALLRPDCYFIMDKKGILPMSARTDRELREAHNLEKMYKSNTFTTVVK